jgi:hypothetical protein
MGTIHKTFLKLKKLKLILQGLRMILELDKSLPPGETEISRLSRRNFREGKPNESKTQARFQKA